MPRALVRFEGGHVRGQATRSTPPIALDVARDDGLPDSATLFEAAGVPLVVLDAGCRIVSVNAAWRAANQGVPGDAYVTADNTAREQVREVREGGAAWREVVASSAAIGGSAYKLRVVCVGAEPRRCLVTHLPLSGLPPSAAEEDRGALLRAELDAARKQRADELSRDRRASARSATRLRRCR